MEPQIYGWLFILVLGGNGAEHGMPIQMTKTEEACKFIAAKTSSEYGLPTSFRCVPIIQPRYLTPNVHTAVPQMD